ncbi:hypothetical protein HHL16_21455 [Pseudoflavitalea sp. G-6-1-2]|uniref:hypothetical protein n=1 Tax=Pseudoflavitalea sp. G-6-1-2 TaxID=2728841 RepID=UPI001469EE15|nr:hypothetical protein [Pseudoflavitalea sp. G-6-1-2]NML23461.1 hypothetical protein [Pseudoflavitalea sp. G-6-1-2]
MEKYLNKSGNSPISKYQIEDERITVWYNDDTSYSYSYPRAGKPIVDKLKELAVEGEGLATFISQQAKFLYDHKVDKPGL